MTRLNEPDGRNTAAMGRVLVVAVVLGVLVFALWAISTGAIHFFSANDAPDKTNPTGSASPARPTTGSTAPVKDADLQFQLRSVRTNGAGNLVVTLTVKNLSSLFVSCYGEQQVLKGSGNRTVRGAPALTSLEPHETAGIAVVFAVPSDFHATRLVLHSAPASPGVVLSLG